MSHHTLQPKVLGTTKKPRTQIEKCIDMKPTYVLGISCYYHDAAAALIRDGVVIAAAAEERFTRKKHDNTFPQHAVEYCLKSAGIAANDISAVVFYEKPIVKFERIINQYLDSFPFSFRSFITTMHQWITQKLKIQSILKKEFHYHGEVFFTDHHLAHAASAYYLSGFDKSVILTLDGVGEWSTTTIGFAEGSDIRLDQEIRFPHSLGLFYSALTSYLGFSVNDAEYKVMGLAAYGSPLPYTNHFKKIIHTHPDGSFSLDMAYFDFSNEKRMFTQKLCDLLGAPPRVPESAMHKNYEDIAAALQKRLEEVVFHMLHHAYKKYSCTQVCLAGGVALNSVMNGKLLTNTPFKKLYIPPDPGDAGGAIGAALHYYFTVSTASQKPKPQEVAHHFTPYLGPKFFHWEVAAALKKRKLTYTRLTTRKALLQKTAQLLKEEKIIGWFQGRMEWGPRALGSRSILASAARTEMRDIINEKVKHRELFRPFAPVILEEYAHEYFKADKNLPISARYMLMVYPFEKIGFSDVPAVVHVDKTGRLQTLHRDDNPLYYDVISEYHRLTKVPIIINTSFNVRGEPIVCTPEDAINCFLTTDIDYLVIDQYIVAK